MKRAVLAVAAVILAAAGSFAGTAEAHASVPIFPSCLRALLADGHVRIWVNPGNLYENPTRIVAGRQGEDKTTLTRRRDGVWIGTVSKTPDFTYYFKMHAPNEVNGAWIKCKKIQP